MPKTITLSAAERLDYAHIKKIGSKMPRAAEVSGLELW